jgi:hypothetical protein
VNSGHVNAFYASRTTFATAAPFDRQAAERPSQVLEMTVLLEHIAHPRNQSNQRLATWQAVFVLLRGYAGVTGTKVSSSNVVRVLCLVCHYAAPQFARIGCALGFYLHWPQGVPGAGTRTACPLFMREPGADDDWPRQLQPRGRWQVVGVAV